MKNHAVIVLDCGATNVRAVAVDQNGQILSAKSYPNQTSDDPYFKNGKIWDVDAIWLKLCEASKAVIARLKDVEIIGVCTCTFGVDGAPFDKKGEALYPVISWACQRTQTILDELHELIPLMELYKTTGVHHFTFNTLYKLYWLKKHKPELIKEMDHWLFMPSILSSRLCGSIHTDATMIGTSMLSDIETRDCSIEILEKLNLNNDHFPRLKEAGQIIGKVSRASSSQTGIPQGLPVLSAGHDTQFAIFGSGANVNEPVLSSGTWEILMVRTPEVQTDQRAFDAGITTEYDAIPGLYNPGIQWLGSGILEWIKKNLFADIASEPDIYDIMINEAGEAGESKLEIFPDFLNNLGEIKNLNVNSSRGEIYYAALKALALKTKESLNILEENCGFKASSLIIVGGGSKNELWNSLRKKELTIDIKTIPQTETTVLGAAMFAFAGCEYYASAEEARKKFINN